MAGREWEEEEVGPDQVGWLGLCNALKKPGRVHEDGSRMRCGMAAGQGTDHVGSGPCKFHGGSLPVVLNKIEKQAAGRLLATYGVARQGKVDPRDCLAEELSRTMGHIDWLAEVIRGMDPDALVLGVTSMKEGEAGGERVWEVAETAAPSVWLGLYQKEREFGYKLSKDIVGLGIMERRVELDRAHAGLLARVLIAVTSRLGSLSLEDRNALPGLLRDELMGMKTEVGVVEAGERGLAEGLSLAESGGRVDEVVVMGESEASVVGSDEGSEGAEPLHPPTHTPLPQAPLPGWSGKTPQSDTPGEIPQA